MEEEDTIIIKVIFKFEDSRLYTFDVDRTTTLYETKKILANAAHILKNSFILFHEGQEVTKDRDSLALYKIFPTLKKIEFFLKLKKSEEEVDENDLNQNQKKQKKDENLEDQQDQEEANYQEVAPPKIKDLPKFDLSKFDSLPASAEAKVRNGNPVSFSAPDGTYRVCSQQGEFLALGKCEDGIMKTIKSFFEV